VAVILIIRSKGACGASQNICALYFSGGKDACGAIQLRSSFIFKGGGTCGASQSRHFVMFEVSAPAAPV